MSDRELLELAAKAATYEYECASHTGYPKDDQHQIRAESGSLMEWNPLIDDGDALRLAVKLGMNLHLPGPNTVFGVCNAAISKEIIELATQDPFAATRRAIVKAAAEIGKTKGEVR